MGRKKSEELADREREALENARDGENRTVKIVIAGLFWRAKRGDKKKSKTTQKYNRTFPGLNDFINASHAVNERYLMKKKYQEIACTFIRRQTDQKLKGNLFVFYDFYEVDKRRDPSNIASLFIKIFEDALQECEVIQNDSWNIQGYACYFHVDKENPRVEVSIQEI